MDGDCGPSYVRAHSEKPVACGSLGPLHYRNISMPAHAAREGLAQLVAAAAVDGTPAAGSSTLPTTDASRLTLIGNRSPRRPATPVLAELPPRREAWPARPDQANRHPRKG